MFFTIIIIGKEIFIFPENRDRESFLHSYSLLVGPRAVGYFWFQGKFVCSVCEISTAPVQFKVKEGRKEARSLCANSPSSS